MNKKPVIASWSGGKDGCLACYKVMKAGYEIECLLNFITAGDDRCCFHGVDGGIIRLQAQSIGIPLVQKECAAGMGNYEEEFKEAVGRLNAGGSRKMIFGDIYLLDNVSWVERVCKEIGIAPVEPLWNVPAEELIEEFIGLDFKAIIVSCKADVLGREFIGKCIDRDMVKEFKARGICPCGENGEYHTLVIDGPIFKRKIEIMEADCVLKDGFWKHWSLDIKRYS